MIAIDKEYTTVVYSLGKCGTTSFVNALDDNWQFEGEHNPTWFRTKNENDAGKPLPQLDVLHQAVSDYNCAPVFIIRDPWLRYVSGIKEVMQDFSSALLRTQEQQQAVWNDLMEDDKFLENYISQLFYLTQFMVNEQYQAEHEYNWGRNFSLHENYHTRNWLATIDRFPNARVINCTNLDSYIAELGFTPRKDNTSQRRDLEKIEAALLQPSIKYLVDVHITPEIERYKNLTR